MLMASISRWRPSASCEPKPSSMTRVCRRAPARWASTFESASRMAKLTRKASPPENSSYSRGPAASEMMMSRVSFLSSRALSLNWRWVSKRTDIVPPESRSSSSLAWVSISGRACSISKAGTPSLEKARSSVLSRAICRARSSRCAVSFARRSRCLSSTATRWRAMPTSMRRRFSSLVRAKTSRSTPSTSGVWAFSASYFASAA